MPACEAVYIVPGLANVALSITFHPYIETYMHSVSTQVCMCIIQVYMVPSFRIVPAPMAVSRNHALQHVLTPGPHVFLSELMFLTS